MDTMLHRPPLLLSTGDRRRIEAFAVNALAGQPRLAGPLLCEVERASVIAERFMPPNVAGLGSWVRYQDVGTRETREVRLVAKRPAETEAGEVSLLEPIGAALVGLAVGQSILWQDGLGRQQLVDVLGVTRAEDSHAKPAAA